MDPFCKKWKLESSDKFEEYMDALGVGTIKKQLGKRASPTQDISKVPDSEDEYVIKTCTGSIGFTTTVQFKLGEEFEETTMDGRKVKTSLTLEDGKLLQTQEGTPTCKITREIVDGKYVMTLEIPEKDVVCKRIYAEVPKA